MHFGEFQLKYSCQEFYTDLSKFHAGVSYAALGPSFSESVVLHPETSIFSVKPTYERPSYSQTLSVVRFRKHNLIVKELYSLLSTAYISNQLVVICCVPGHKGIEGNILAVNVGH